MTLTLQSYIARELMKSFLLAAAGLTLVFSLCGAVLNMIRGDLLTAVQVFKVMLFVVPISVTFTLPISGLFACAIVYGRIASDNEFDACKASGIDILRLLFPAFALSVLVAGVTFTMSNYVLPTFKARMEALVRQDIQKFVQQSLNKRGYIKFNDYIVSVDVNSGASVASEENTFVIKAPRYMELESDELVRAGTADFVQVRFGSDPESGDPSVSAVLHNVRALDIQRNQVIESGRQRINPMLIPPTLKFNPAWLALDDLIAYRREPVNLPNAKNDIVNTRAMIREAMFYRWVIETMDKGQKSLTLGDNELSYEIKAKRLTPDEILPTLDVLKPRILGVEVIRRTPKGTRHYTSGRADFDVRNGYGQQRDQVSLTLQDGVEFYDADDPENVVRPKNATLDRVDIPAFIGESEAQLGDKEVLGIDVEGPNQIEDLGLGNRLHDRRIATSRTFAELVNRLSGLIHSRIAFASSSLLMLVLAAALGVIFRGGQVMVAFAIAFIPCLVVFLLISLGRQFINEPDRLFIGLSVIWSGLVLVALADILVLGRFLKR